jgi:hypothetical protein
MEEKVGTCVGCRKTIYCLDGFLDGVITEEKILFCYSCLKEKAEFEKEKL